MGKIRGFFLFNILLSFFLCSCHPNSEEKAFFKNFMRWQDSDNSFVFETQGKSGDVGYGKILLDNEYVDAYIQFCPRSGSKMTVVEIDEKYCLEKGFDKSCSIIFSREKIKKENGDYFENQIKLTYQSNNFNSSFWENKSIVLFSEKIDKNELDASLFEDLDFTVKDLGIHIQPLNNHWDDGRNPLKWVFILNNAEYILVFGENHAFKIEGNISTFGTYVPDYEFLTLNFESMNIFDKNTSSSVFIYNF